MRIKAGKNELSDLKVCGVLLMWAVFIGVCGMITEVALSPASSKEADNASKTLITLVALSLLIAGIFVLHCLIGAGKLPWLRKH